MYSAELLAFLEELRVNNNKAWFDSNRNRYEDLRARFTELVEEILAETSRFDPSVAGLTAKDCIFRINRDVRFSKDKSPYKTSFSASISPGNADHAHLGYYLSFDAAGDLLAGGGLHMPAPDVLQQVRAAIAEDGERLARIVNAPAFLKKYGSVEGERLKNVPREYSAEHPHGELLKYKSFTVGETVQAATVPDDRLAPHIVGVFQGVQPFLKFFVDAGA